MTRPTEPAPRVPWYRRPRLPWTASAVLIVLIGTVCLLYVGTPSTGWLLFLGSLAAAVIALSQLLPERFRAVQFCLIPAVLAVVVLGVIVGSPIASPLPAVKARFNFRRAALTEQAQRLLSNNQAGQFNGTGMPPRINSVLGDQPAPLPTPEPIGGVPIAYGTVTTKTPRQVEYCLSDRIPWACTESYIYDPDHAITDGDAGGWNVDCDLVTNALGNDWFYKAMECGGDRER